MTDLREMRMSVQKAAAPAIQCLAFVTKHYISKFNFKKGGWWL